MNHRGRWRIGALASAVALLGSLASLEVHALALGRITVQSALGEPLRGEIEITQINPEEASSLKVGIASPEMFKAAGLEYPSAAAGLEIKLQRRADGRPYLHLSSNRAVTEPFVDLILEASSASGRITRDYTMLLDPPVVRAASTASAPVPTAPILPRSSAVQPAKEVPSEAKPSPAAPVESQPRPVAKTAEPQAAPAEKTSPDGLTQVTVKKGDNASKIAADNKPESVSLDQMLVALLKGNPSAFIGGNINVLKSGSVLTIPSEETISAVSPDKASRIIVAQSRDFNAFRRKLAEGVATTPVAGADRQAGGTLQAKVEDRALPNAAPDKLTLSKGALQGKPAGTAEDKIAKEKEAKDNSTRMAELSKNIDDLNKLAGVPATTASAATLPANKPASAAAVSGIQVPTPAGQPAIPASSAAVPPAPVAATLPAASAASAAVTVAAPASAASSAEAPLASASEPALAASASAAVASKPVAVKKPVVPPPEPELIDQLLDDPLPLLGGVGLLALLGGGGYAFTRYRRKKKNQSAPVDSSFLESRLQPDSFFGASGGSRVNTNSENNITGSSMAYTPSQMDASGDVDPVAEADVYLAYGRDEQAEEILKEALHTYPTRVAIHAKLLEIYAKRRDIKTFENLAGEAFKLTQGHGPEWAFIVELGAELDPGNPLYNAGGAGAGKAAQEAVAISAPSSAEAAPHPAAAPAPMEMAFSQQETPRAPAPVAAASPTPLPTAPAPQVPSPATATPPASTLDELDLGLDFDIEPPPSAPAKPAAAPQAQPPQIESLAQGLNFTPEPFVPAKPAPKPAPAPAPAAATADAGMLEFDLDSFSLDISAPADTQSPEQDADAEDPLEVKFLLAEEFRSLGDTDGARSLADEVLSKAKGPLKVKVQAFLNTLS